MHLISSGLHARMLNGIQKWHSPLNHFHYHHSQQMALCLTDDSGPRTPLRRVQLDVACAADNTDSQRYIIYIIHALLFTYHTWEQALNNFFRCFLQDSNRAINSTYTTTTINPTWSNITGNILHIDAPTTHTISSWTRHTEQSLTQVIDLNTEESTTIKCNHSKSNYT